MAPEHSASEHEATPGMYVLTIIYNVLFFGLYIYYFWDLANRWKVG